MVPFPVSCATILRDILPHHGCFAIAKHLMMAIGAIEPKTVNGLPCLLRGHLEGSVVERLAVRNSNGSTLSRVEPFGWCALPELRVVDGV